jgi:ELWxxDGT repeat protein
VLFTAEDATSGAELWISDGTEAGTLRVKDIRPGTQGGTPQFITPLGDGRAVFRANEGTAGIELWITDGTEAGTVRLKDIRPGATGSLPANFFLLQVNAPPQLALPVPDLKVTELFAFTFTLPAGTFSDADVPGRTTRSRSPPRSRPALRRRPGFLSTRAAAPSPARRPPTPPPRCCCA